MKGNLPKPIKKQREVLYMPVAGHTAVLGTAGSGKTTLALYRAAYLSEQSMPHSGRTLLLTFNKTLVTYLKHLKPNELQNVQVETYHTFARGYLNARGKMGYNCICSDPDLRKEYIFQAVKANMVALGGWLEAGRLPVVDIVDDAAIFDALHCLVNDE